MLVGVDQSLKRRRRPAHLTHDLLRPYDDKHDDGQNQQMPWGEQAIEHRVLRYKSSRSFGHWSNRQAAGQCRRALA